MNAAPDASRRPAIDAVVIACLAATWLIWGSTYLAIKFAVTGFPPFFMMGTRFVVAGATLVAYMRLRGSPLPSRRQWLNATIVGLLMLGLGMGCTARAEQTLSSGLVVAFIAVTPLLVVLARLPFGVRPARAEIVGILVGLGGVLMLTQGAGFKGSPAGLAVLVVACIGWTLGSVLSQQHFKLAPGPMGFASEMLCGGIFLLVVSALVGERPVLAAGIGPWLSWAYLVVFGSLLAFNAYMHLLGRVSSGLALSYTYVNPIIAMQLGVMIGGEHISAWEWLSASVVLVGVVLLLVARR
jgi:drug/metabolite transporter (DMT)-like permease